MKDINKKKFKEENVNKVSLEKMADLIKTNWAPLDVFRVNDISVRLVKIKGKYHWHKHSNQDELFIVLKGAMNINFENDLVELNEGEGFVVPRATRHQSEAKEETLVLLVEPTEIVTEGD